MTDLDKICSDLFLNCSKFNDLKCIEKIQNEYSCQCSSTICQYSIVSEYLIYSINLFVVVVLLVNKQIIGFTKDFCQDEYLQDFHWKAKMINQSQYLSCPSPCTGIFY